MVGIDIEACAACGGALRIIACIEDPEVIEKIPAHLDKKTTTTSSRRGVKNCMVTLYGTYRP